MVRALDCIFDTVWAMPEEYLRQMIVIANRQGDPESVVLQSGRRMANTKTATIRDGVATVPIYGPIFRRANLMTEISGATSVDVLARDLREASVNEDVRAIVLDIDSPGGQASGVGEMAEHISSMCKKKKVYAYSGGLMASAAYWLGCAASEIIISPTALIGSIGVVAAYSRGDRSEVEFVSSQSPKKRVDLETEEGRANIQSTLDDLASVFIADVSKYRGVSEEKVMADFGQGGILVGKKAVRAGMVTRIGTYESVMSRAVSFARGEVKSSCEPEFTSDTIAETALAAVTFEHQLNLALAAVESCVQRGVEVTALRREEGRELSAARANQFREMRTRIDSLLTQGSDRKELLREFLSHQAAFEATMAEV